MTSSNIQKMMEQTLAQLPGAAENGPEACQALLSSFFADIAVDAADRAYFETDHYDATAQTKAAVIEVVATDIIVSISETLQSAGLDDGRWALEVKAAATRAFYNRLAELDASPNTGGQA